LILYDFVKNIGRDYQKLQRREVKTG